MQENFYNSPYKKTIFSMAYQTEYCRKFKFLFGTHIVVNYERYLKLLYVVAFFCRLKKKWKKGYNILWCKNIDFLRKNYSDIQVLYLTIRLMFCVKKKSSFYCWSRIDQELFCEQTCVTKRSVGIHKIIKI